MTIDRDDDELRRLISERAAEWRLRVEEWLSQGDRLQYLHWLKRSQDHVAAALALDQLAKLLRDARLRMSSEDGDTAVNIVDLYPREHHSLRARFWYALSSWKVAAAAAVVVMIVASLTLAMNVTQHDQVITTDDREWHVQVLDDGSTMRVGPLSHLRVRFSDRQRSVRVMNGDALFEIAKDASRPFIVSTGVGTARAVGTKFGVTHHDANMIVTVAEGEVAVTRTESFGSGRAAVADRSVTLSVGKQVYVSNMRLHGVRQVDVDNELAWVRGQLVFSKHTIGEAALEFNRRNRLQLEVRDAIIAGRPVHGVFDVANPRGFAEFLAGAGPIRVVEVGDGVLRLESAVPRAGAVNASAAGRKSASQPSRS